MTRKKQEVGKVPTTGKIPNLRFPGFQGEWETKKLGEIMKIGSGKDYKHLSTGNIPVYGTGGYMLSVNEYLYDGESVCIGRKGTIDKPMFLNEKFWTVDTLFYTHSFKKSLPKYIYLTFLSIDWQKYNEASGVPSLSKTTIETIQIPLPPLKEQEKIAEILTTWDEAITKQTELLEAKELLKKALMQKLLSGKVRFTGFSDKWKEVILGDIGKAFNGLSGKTGEDFGIGESKYITYKNIFDNSKIKLNIFDNVQIFNDEKQNLVQFGDIFFTVSSETPEEVGMSSVLLDNVSNTYLNSFCFGYRLHNFNTLDPHYARFYFRSFQMRDKISRLAQGSTRFNLSKNEIMKLKVYLPSLVEQQKITEVLSLADDEINLLKNELEELKLQKKALMQKLLTGEVRVKV